MAETAAPPRPAMPDRGPRYDEGFALWSEHQAALIRARHFELVDWDNVAEEIESLGISDRRQLRNRLGVLKMHLLKWQFQPMHRSRSWQSTIRVQRGHVEQLLRESPSLSREVANLARSGYAAAREEAAAETGFALKTLPRSLPYPAEQILDDGFYPGPIDAP